MTPICRMPSEFGTEALTVVLFKFLASGGVQVASVARKKISGGPVCLRLGSQQDNRKFAGLEIVEKIALKCFLKVLVFAGGGLSRK